jgi:short-subunit dehydrogenase
MKNDLIGRTALVTGASSGMGSDYARELAARGVSLVLVARRAEPLEQLAEELRAKFSVSVRVMPADLANETARQQLHDDLAKSGIAIDLLINNAGFGLFGPFAQSEWPRVRQLLDLDITGLTHLTHLFLPKMLERHWGRILLVASTVAFQPTPGYAVYAAAKTYVLSSGPALNRELRASGVSCTTICPGVTETPFFEIAGQKKNLYHRLTGMKSDVVVHHAIEALIAGRTTAVAGWFNSALALSTRFAPRGVVTVIAERLMSN